MGVTPAPLFGLTVTVKDVLITWGPLPTVTWTVELVKAGPLPVASIVMGALMALLVAWTQPVSAPCCQDSGAKVTTTWQVSPAAMGLPATHAGLPSAPVKFVIVTESRTNE